MVKRINNCMFFVIKYSILIILWQVNLPDLKLQTIYKALRR